MAIYHLSVSNVSRASGSRATATLSYITGKRVHDERRGETYDYGRKERVLRVGTLLPEGAPAEFADPAVLFNAVELHETGRTARPAKKIVVALPREFTPRQRVQALEEYIRENLNADGYAATYAIHEDREGNNPHAHILVANRQIDPATGGWARLKQRMEYVLDELREALEESGVKRQPSRKAAPRSCGPHFWLFPRPRRHAPYGHGMRVLSPWTEKGGNAWRFESMNVHHHRDMRGSPRVQPPVHQSNQHGSVLPIS